MRVASVISLLVLAACETAPAPSVPPGVSRADLAQFRTAMADNGCEVTSDAQAAPVEAATGFSDDKLTDIADYLMATGELATLPGGIRLTTGRCANA